ncbi:MAG: histidine--tRNA ligase, partial [Flavisolibacter sp.]
TIPFARYVAMNHGQLTFPFKRYKIQPVWRADRPQRGRYREFYQCDADVVGSNSLLNEIELTNIYSTVFEQLKIPVEIKINSRKILSALADISGGADKMMDITIAIDKLDKIGLEKVKEELDQRGLNETQVETISTYLQVANRAGENELVIKELRKLLGDNQKGVKGLDELEHILSQTNNLSQTNKIIVDPTLARGLNYYTGTIFEIKATGVKMGSIGGGGRYDDLTGLFGVPNIPGVGISFGVDRIYDVLEELNLFPAAIEQGTKVLFFNLGDEESKTAYTLLQQVRNAGTAAEIFHEAQKFDKQFKYAEKKNVPFVVIIGSAEVAEKNALVKDLRNGEQQKIPFENLPHFSFI